MGHTATGSTKSGAPSSAAAAPDSSGAPLGSEKRTALRRFACGLPGTCGVRAVPRVFRLAAVLRTRSRYESVNPEPDRDVLGIHAPTRDLTAHKRHQVRTQLRYLLRAYCTVSVCRTMCRHGYCTAFTASECRQIGRHGYCTAFTASECRQTGRHDSEKHPHAQGTAKNDAPVNGRGSANKRKRFVTTIDRRDVLRSTGNLLLGRPHRVVLIAIELVA